MLQEFSRGQWSNGSRRVINEYTTGFPLAGFTRTGCMHPRDQQLMFVSALSGVGENRRRGGRGSRRAREAFLSKRSTVTTGTRHGAAINLWALNQQSCNAKNIVRTNEYPTVGILFLFGILWQGAQGGGGKERKCHHRTKNGIISHFSQEIYVSVVFGGSCTPNATSACYPYRTPCLSQWTDIVVVAVAVGKHLQRWLLLRVLWTGRSRCRR